jgi:hypothetical protein
MPIIQTCLAQNQSGRPKTTRHSVCVEYVSLSCCLSAKQMTKTQQYRFLLLGVGPRPGPGRRLVLVLVKNKVRT